MELAPGQTAGQAIVQIATTLQSVMAANLAGVVTDGSAEYLHNVRVSMRRTRVLLKECRGQLDRQIRRDFNSRFRDLGRIPGQLRDYDVFLLKGASLLEELPASRQPAGEALFRLIRARRAAVHRECVAVLESDPFLGLMRDWRRFLEEAGTGGPTFFRQGSLAAEIWAHRVLQHRTRLFSRQAMAISTARGHGELHRLRIQAKFLRYDLEFCRGLFPPPPLLRAVAGLKKLQDLLGEFQDLETQRRILRRIVSPAGTSTGKAEWEGAGKKLDRNMARRQDHLGRRAVKLTPRLCRGTIVSGVQELLTPDRIG